jgi:hypothetical protein
MRLRLILIALAVLFAPALFFSVRAELRTRAQLQQQLKTAQASLDAATATESARNLALQKQLAQLKKKAAQVTTPQQVVGALPSVLPLPEPIALEPATPDNPTPKTAQLPIADLKPLYDSAIACKECQAELAASQANLKDEQAKTQTVSRELTDALRASKGGSPLRRIARAAKWFLIGAAAGAAAAKLSK